MVRMCAAASDTGSPLAGQILVGEVRTGIELHDCAHATHEEPAQDTRTWQLVQYAQMLSHTWLARSTDTPLTPNPPQIGFRSVIGGAAFYHTLAVSC